MTALPGGRRGATLALVLWILVALGALAWTAALAARVDLALARAWGDHAAALGLAEAGVADAMESIAVEGRLEGKLEGSLSTGRYRVEWGIAGGGVRVVATGARGDVERAVEARVEADGETGGLRIAAWREVR